MKNAAEKKWIAICAMLGTNNFTNFMPWWGRGQNKQHITPSTLVEVC